MKINKKIFIGILAIVFTVMLSYRFYLSSTISFHKVPSNYTNYNLNIRYTDTFHQVDVEDKDLINTFDTTYETDIWGNGYIEFEFTADGKRSNTETIEIPLKPDWNWSVSFHIEKENPYDFCMGCSGYKEVEFEDSNNYKLFIIWGGNSIRQPVVY